MTTEHGVRLAAAFARELPDGGDHASLRRAAAGVLRQRLPYAFGIWATLDPLTSMWTSCVLDGFDRDLALERAVFDKEYRVEDRLKLRDLARGDRAGALSIATGGDLASSARFREVFEPMGVTDELRMVFSVGGATWGALVLLAQDRRFGEDDLATVRAIRAPFSSRLRDALLLSTVHQSWQPGTLTCTEDGRVTDLTPTAAALLGATSSDDVPAAVSAAVVRFGADGTVDSVTAVGSTWLTLRCVGLDHRVLVVVDRIDPHRLADVLIEGAGLTPREHAVLAIVLRGATARAASMQLRMSEHTVNDHLKHIFTKFGVGTRAELVAHLFTQHYAVPHAQGATPSARGHFAEGRTSARASALGEHRSRSTDP